MPDVIRGQLGGHVGLEITARELRNDSEDGREFDVNGMRIVSIKDPTGAALASNTIPAVSFVSNGVYVTMWDTRALTVAGYYKFELAVTVGWDTVAQTGTTVAKHFHVLLLSGGA